MRQARHRRRNIYRAAKLVNDQRGEEAGTYAAAALVGALYWIDL